MVRRRRAARLGELLTRNATLEALADQAAQLSIGGVECRPMTRTALLSRV